jgi:hypothetical protein
VDDIVRLGTAVPFRQAVQLLAHFRRVTVSEATVRRLTEASGADYEAVQTAAVEELERTVPPAPAGPAVQQLSVDGAMVPLVGGEWAEVKTLVIGTVTTDRAGEPHATELSYFSRMLDHERFGRLATVETHRRGTEQAGAVCAVVDGAEWQQKFIDLHRPDAVRILDFPHAASYVAQAAQAVFGVGTAQTSEWVGRQLHALRHGEAEHVLDALRCLLVTPLEKGATEHEARQAVMGSLTYLEKRQEQLRYAAFHAQGYPIGSGVVESANKLVVEARLKGAGMHWSRPHVNPMVALRTLECNGRWDEGWREMRRWQRAHQQTRAAERRKGPQTPAAPIAAASFQGRTPLSGASSVTQIGTAPTPQRQPPLSPRRPPPTHPWRRISINSARASSPPHHPKT